MQGPSGLRRISRAQAIRILHACAAKLSGKGNAHDKLHALLTDWGFPSRLRDCTEKDLHYILEKFDVYAFVISQTQRKVAYILTLMRKARYDEPLLKAYIKKRFDKDALEFLDENERRSVIKMLNNYIEKGGYKQ